MKGRPGECAGADRLIAANFALIIPEMQAVTSTPGTLVFAWPSALPGWVLEESPDLGPGSWVPSAREVTVNGDNNEVVVTPLDNSMFFRLTHP